MIGCYLISNGDLVSEMVVNVTLFEKKKNPSKESLNIRCALYFEISMFVLSFFPARVCNSASTLHTSQSNSANQKAKPQTSDKQKDIHVE